MENIHTMFAISESVSKRAVATQVLRQKTGINTNKHFNKFCGRWKKGEKRKKQRKGANIQEDAKQENVINVARKN